MEPRTLLDFLGRIEPLKSVPRHSQTAAGLPESVAAHSWRLAVLSLLLAPSFPELDMGRVTRMCLVHDFGEAVTGDVPAFVKTDKNEQSEDAAVASLLSSLPEGERAAFSALFAEWDAQETSEARLAKALDRMEAVVSHNESPIESWIPLEYTLNLTYGAESAVEFPYLAALREEMRLDTLKKIERESAGKES